MRILARPQLPDSPSTRGRLSRVVWHTIGLVLAALLAYAVWRGYQNPELILNGVGLCYRSGTFSMPIT